MAPTFRNPDVFNPRPLASSFNVATRMYSGLCTPNMESPAMRSPRGNDKLQKEQSKILIND